MGLTLKAKVLFISVAVLFAAIGANTLFSSILLRGAYSEALQESAFVTGETLKSELEKLLKSGTPIDRVRGFEAQCRELVTRYSDLSYAMVVDPNGKILFHDTPSHHHQVISDLDILMGIDSQENTSRIYSGAREAFYDFTIPVFDLGGDHVAAVRVGFPTGLISQKTGSLIIRTVGSSLFFFGLGILLLIVFISFWVARPLAELFALIQGTGQQTSGSVQPVETDSSDELGLVTRAFQQMKLEIKASDEKIRKYTRDSEMEARERTPKLRTSYERLKQYIAERKGMEESLWRLQKRYRTILESIEDGYYEVDIAGNFTFFNEALCRMFGYARDELMGMNNRDYMSPEDSKRAYKIFKSIYQTGKSTRIVDWEFVRKDGSIVYIESSASLIRNSEGEPTGFRGIVRDTTERKRMEEVLKTEPMQRGTVLS